ncbi:GMC family oxidoreductase [Modestobacter sp. VKM Ac-2985]|uniref:GMC family oxidoreductase n=1 Tax=Modestobacter sp. VKM Ac-2985 TaxID=3004139 RepID=UPI0022ABA8D0|nr:GMC family oxidoreductase N-terminal domain-containing protein [Modestobacter sp. VKM Ac-2985]MCZ2839612.1 GMC family oxidoreductase N-terminal domain-containing protein [Modestobacter sp. VKM Ac-2985]
MSRPRPSTVLHGLDVEQAAEVFDYVVVGAGTAGSVIAARLTEDVHTRVLLIEAGSATALPEMETPGIWPLLLGTSADWGDSTVEQAFLGAPLYAPRGKALGGSSSINGLNFLRGHRSSYDAWAAQGATGWGFDDLLPDFRRSETTVGRDETLRGTEGPLLIGVTPEPSPVVVAALEAATEVGWSLADDISSGAETGFGLSDANVHEGRRMSAADAYLRPIAGRANLTIVTDVTVRQLTIDDGTCTGVEYGTPTSSTAATALREVILTAGAIGSAQLLMLSGVGPAEHLTELGIEVELDLPGVGANLHDHPMSTVVFEHAAPLPGDPQNIYGQGVGLVRTREELADPDLQVLLISQPYRSQSLPGPGPDGGYAIGFSAMLPHSRGTVRLASRDHRVAPLIDPNYLGEAEDQQVMLAGLRIAREIGAADALAPWRGPEVQPGRPLDSEEAMLDYLRESLVVYFHYAGTCRMGSDDLAVVDPELRVRGISRLRVADASVMPSPVSGNTNATVFAIAERAARIIRS